MFQNSQVEHICLYLVAEHLSRKLNIPYKCWYSGFPNDLKMSGRRMEFLVFVRTMAFSLRGGGGQSVI